MRSSLILGIFCLLGFSALSSAFKSYKGSQVWRLNSNILAVEDVMSEYPLADVWLKSEYHWDVRVDRDMMNILRDDLYDNLIHYEVIVEDLDMVIQEEHDRLAAAPTEFNSSDYNSFEQIEAFLQDVANNNPNATLKSLGKTLEDRDLWQIKFSVDSGATTGTKPSVWFDCGIHAREWLGTSTCVWGIERINDSYGIDSDITGLLDSYDVYIMPVYNADGYSYTWTDDRMWRKNRARPDGNLCVGTDLNRNFDNHFGGEGTSNNSCSEIYHGPSANSELETQAVVAAFNSMMENDNLTFFFSIHTFSQLWMYPWGWTEDLTPDNDEIERVAYIGADALTSVYNTSYEVGSISNAIYIDSGSSTDWTYARGLIQTHTLELRPARQIIGSGFVQNASEIVPTATETWAGMITAIAAL